MSRKHDSQYRAPADPYAAHRCICGHILYADMLPGDPCLFCACKEHRPQAVQS